MFTFVSERFIASIDHVSTGQNMSGLDFLLWKKRFLNIICSEVSKLLLMRFSIRPARMKQVKHTRYSKQEKRKERLTNTYPLLKLCRGEVSMLEQLRRSGLCIHDYFGTT